MAIEAARGRFVEVTMTLPAPAPLSPLSLRGSEGAAAIPTLEHDTLLASARGRWRMPPALQRRDFERVFQAKDRTASFDSTLARIRAGHFRTAGALARYFGKAHSWTGSLMWLCLREKLVSDTATWHSYFPNRPKTRGLRRRQKPARSFASYTFSLPPLDDDDDPY